MTKTYDEWLKAVSEQYFDKGSWIPTHTDILSKVPKEYLTEELCLAAVIADGLSLQYVPEELRTLEICLAAVEDAYEYIANVHLFTFDGCALQFVPDEIMSHEICSLAVRTTPWALEYVPQRFLDIDVCVDAVFADAEEALEFVPTKFLSEIALRLIQDYYSFSFLYKLPEDKWTPEIVAHVIEEGDEEYIELIPEHLRS